MGRGKPRECKAQAISGVQGEADLCDQCLSPLTDNEITDPDTGAIICVDCYESNVGEDLEEGKEAISNLWKAWDSLEWVSSGLTPAAARALLEDQATEASSYAEDLVRDAINDILGVAAISEEEEEEEEEEPSA